MRYNYKEGGKVKIKGEWYKLKTAQWRSLDPTQLYIQIVPGQSLSLRGVEPLIDPHGYIEPEEVLKFIDLQEMLKVPNNGAQHKCDYINRLLSEKFHNGSFDEMFELRMQ